MMAPNLDLVGMRAESSLVTCRDDNRRDIPDISRSTIIIQRPG